MRFDRWLLNFLRREASKDVATRRLKLVLIQDRIGIEPELLDTLKQDLQELLSRYFEISQTGFEMDLHREDEQVALVANIPIDGLKVHRQSRAS